MWVLIIGGLSVLHYPWALTKTSLCVQNGNGIQPASPLVKNNVISNFIHVYLFLFLVAEKRRKWVDTDAKEEYQLIKEGDKANKLKNKILVIIPLTKKTDSSTRVKRKGKVAH